MTIVTEPGQGPLVQRVRGILLQPSAEWDRIDAEPATVKGLFTGYAAILAAIPAVCGAIGGIVFGYGVPGLVSFRPSPISVIVQAVVGYLISLAAVFVLGLIIDALAPTFGGQKDRLKAMKVAVYSYTAAWLAGVFTLVPMLAALGIVGLYSFYLLYRGLPRLMKAPQEKAMGYVAVVVLAGIVLSVVIAMVLAPLRMIGAASALGTVGAVSSPGGTVQIGGASVDVDKLQAASRQMEASAARMQAAAAASAAGAGAVAVKGGVPGEVLKGLLPAAVNGFARTEVSAESVGTPGMGTTHAQGRYARGSSTLTLEVTDMAAAAGLAGMASAFNVNQTKETATGYEKVATIGGRLTTEEYDRSSKHGKFGVMVGGRFMVQAEGDEVGVDDLKAAVNAVGIDRLETMAKS